MQNQNPNIKFGNEPSRRRSSWRITLDVLVELVKLKDVVWDVGEIETGIFSEHDSQGIKEPSVKNTSIIVEADNGHFHIKSEKVAKIQFVESERGHYDRPIRYIRLVNHEGQIMLRIVFPSPYSDDDHNATDLQPERLKAYEDVRDRFLGRELTAVV